MASQTMRLNTSRLAELRRALILDSSPERAYDDITRLLATALAVPITMVNLLDAERDWFKSCVGIQQTQTQTQTQSQSQSQSPAVTSFCEVFFSSTHDLIVVEDTLLDPQFQSHPKVSGDPLHTLLCRCPVDRARPDRRHALRLRHTTQAVGA